MRNLHLTVHVCSNQPHYQPSVAAMWWLPYGSVWISGCHRDETTAYSVSEREAYFVFLRHQDLNVVCCSIQTDTRTSFDHFPMDGHARCFQFFTLIKNVLINIVICISCVHRQVFSPRGNNSRLKSYVHFLLNKHI